MQSSSYIEKKKNESNNTISTAKSVTESKHTSFYYVVSQTDFISWEKLEAAKIDTVKLMINSVIHYGASHNYEEVYKELSQFCKHPPQRYSILKVTNYMPSVMPELKDVWTIHPYLHINDYCKDPLKIDGIDIEKSKKLQAKAKQGFLNEYQQIQQVKETFVFGLYDKKQEKKPSPSSSSESSSQKLKFLTSISKFFSKKSKNNSSEKEKNSFSLKALTKDPIYDEQLVKEIFKFLR